MLSALEGKDVHLIRIATYLSVGIAVFLIILKWFAWYRMGAISLQATLLDSVLDAVASLVNLFAVYHALQPADSEHRFGHGKIESLAALLQSILISLSSLWLFYEATQRFFAPQTLEEISLGVGVMIISMIATGGLVFFQAYVVRKTNSTAIKADSIHYRGDFLMNLGVMVTLIAGFWFQVSFIDPIFGIITAAYIFYSAFDIIKHAFDILIDREFPEEHRKLILDIVRAQSEVLGVHDLRTRSSGARSFIQLHLELDGEMPLRTAHEISMSVSEALLKNFPRAEIIIHQDPYGDHTEVPLRDRKRPNKT